MIISKVCDYGINDVNMLPCDSKRCNAAYHVDCLNLRLSKILEGNFLSQVGIVDESLRTELIPQNFEESSTELAKKYLDIDYFGRLYWGFPCSIDNCGIVMNRNSLGILFLFYLVVGGCTTVILVLKFPFDEAVNTKLFRQILNKSSTELAKKLLAIDTLGRFYWGFPSSSANCGIVINVNLVLETTNVNLCAHTTIESQLEDCGIWYLFRFEEEISSLVDYLNTNDPEAAVHLRESILHWHSSILHGGQQTINNSVEGHMVIPDLNKSSKKTGGVACLDQIASKAWLSKSGPLKFFASPSLQKSCLWGMLVLY